MSNRPSLVKQLSGAVIGGSLGLLVYGAYQVTSPKLTGWLTIPQQWLESNGEGSVVSDKDRTDRTNAHYEARAREIAEEFGAAYKNYQVKEPASAVGSSAGAKSSSSTEGNAADVIPFEGATEDAVDSSAADTNAVTSQASSETTTSDRIEAVRKLWNSDEIEKAQGPDTDELPDSGIGLLGALIAAGAGAGGIRARKRK